MKPQIWHTKISNFESYLRGERGLSDLTIRNYLSDLAPLHKFMSTNQILQAAQSVVRNNTDRVNKNLLSVKGEGDLIGVIETHDEMEEADALVSALEKEIKLEKRNFSDFAILYRTNAQSRPLEDSFRRSGIPYNIVGGFRFYERKEIKDLIAYLRIIVNPVDSVSFNRVINFPIRGKTLVLYFL